ncbi:MAG: arginine--tRNA ligase [Verrucomicrobiales bacterium]|jgi:arginyl-tRNA synthetase|nr:arginine--tRNA ligase [Verrucomicrobiales bacterium]
MSLSAHLETGILEWLRNNKLAVSGGPWVKVCQDERFGHFQTNVAMVAGKMLKKNPRAVAEELRQKFVADVHLAKVDIAGPGFVNFTFTPAALARSLSMLRQDPHLGVAQTPVVRRVVIDFSAPNVAKEMHVGHIRSTVLGETLTRLLAAQGHQVIRDNHLGDWGTQFGKIILGYKRAGQPSLTMDGAVAEMERLYQETHRACEADPALLEAARLELVKLQQGDAENVALWKKFRELSQAAFDQVYERLGVKFDRTLAESFYNPWLNEVVDDLLAKGIAREDKGAVVVYFDDAELKDHPFLIRKSDGASLYATTDLATIRYRVAEFKADALVYVTDGRQQLHFKQLFAAARRWGYTAQEFEHVWFGAITGSDHKPLKTRDGTSVKLRGLLDEAESRAAGILRGKRADIDEDKLREIARVIGLGALKYADLAQNRNLDYVFDWERMLAFDGNTAPYLLNAYVRTRSILRKAGTLSAAAGEFELREQVEQDLARRLLAFGDAVQTAAREYRPHHVCNYLFETAALFHRFFEHCPVLKAESEGLKNSRLQLCQLTGDVLKRGLYLLGLETVEEM